MPSCRSKPACASRDGWRCAETNERDRPEATARSAPQIPVSRRRRFADGTRVLTACFSRRFVVCRCSLSERRERRDELGQRLIEQGRSDFERVRHARDVGLHQQVGGQVEPRIDGKRRVDGIEVLGGRELALHGLIVSGNPAGELMDEVRRAHATPRPIPRRARERRSGHEPRKPSAARIRQHGPTRHPLGRATHHRSYLLPAFGKAGSHMPAVAGEHLVAAVSGERDRHVLARQLREIPRRYWPTNRRRARRHAAPARAEPRRRTAAPRTRGARIQTRAPHVAHAPARRTEVRRTRSKTSTPDRRQAPPSSPRPRSNRRRRSGRRQSAPHRPSACGRPPSADRSTRSTASAWSICQLGLIRQRPVAALARPGAIGVSASAPA